MGFGVGSLNSSARRSQERRYYRQRPVYYQQYAPDYYQDGYGYYDEYDEYVPYRPYRNSRSSQQQRRNWNSRNNTSMRSNSNALQESSYSKKRETISLD